MIAALSTPVAAAVALTATAAPGARTAAFTLIAVHAAALVAATYLARPERAGREARGVPAPAEAFTAAPAGTSTAAPRLRRPPTSTPQRTQQARLAAVGELAASAAHDLNTPLTYVRANLEWLAETMHALAGTVSPGRMSEILDVVRETHEGVERMRRIVRDLGALARPDDDFGPVDLPDVLESALRLASQHLDKRALVARHYGPVPTVEASPTRLSRVFVNLLVNAAQAMPPDAARPGEVRISTRVDEDGAALVEVRDTGQGIPAEVLPRIFEPFFTTKPDGVGTGLGLAICRRLLAGYGGTIAVESREGEGTLVSVRLPASEAAAPQRRCEGDSREPAAPAAPTSGALAPESSGLYPRFARGPQGRERGPATTDAAPRTPHLRRLPTR